MSRQTHSSKVLKVKFIIFLVILTMTFIGFWYFTSSIYGVSVQGTPDHDHPKSCVEEGYEICTTAIGTCTKDKQQCVFPQNENDCKYILQRAIWSKKQKFPTHHPKTKILMSDEQFKKLIEVFSNYCGNPELKFYKQVYSNSTRASVFKLEIGISFIVFFLMYPQIKLLAEKYAF